MVIFKEVLRPPIWVLAFIYFLLLSLVIAIWAAFGALLTIYAFVIATITIIYTAFKMRSTISINQGELRFDNAHIEVKYIGNIKVLDAPAMKLLRTRDADPSAFLAIRFWSSNAAKVDLADDRDTTPYWLITSNNPEKLVEALKN